MSDRTVLEVKDLILRLSGETILDGLSMEFWRGYVHAVIGPNGAGKSTLASTIMGLSGYQGYEGSISLDGVRLDGLSVDERARSGLTMAWQEPARYEGLTVEKFIGSGASDRSPEKMRELLERVGLEPERYLSRAVDQTLSGGERKRVELASILAMRPKVVIMDEPDSGIDVEALNRIFESIGYLKEQGSTVLLITHSLTVLEQADHAFLICDGKLMAKGSVPKIRQYYAEKCVPCDHQNDPEESEING